MGLLFLTRQPVRIQFPVNGQNFSLTNGVLFSQQVQVAGGTGPYTYSVTTGPSGLGVDSSGLLTWPLPVLLGSPHSATIKVTESNGGSHQISVTLTVL